MEAKLLPPPKTGKKLERAEKIATAYATLARNAQSQYPHALLKPTNEPKPAFAYA
jgi:hypothetical protein